MLDATLLRRLRARDQDALQLTTEKYRSYVCTILSNMISGVGCYADVEELCEDVFFSIWQNAEHIEAGKLKAYLGVTARNKAKSWLRGRRELPMDLDEIELPDDALPLEEQAMQQELANRVREAVDALPAREREIFLRYYYYLQTAEEIGRRMGIPPATVRTCLARGRKRLEQRLKKEDLL